MFKLQLQIDRAAGVGVEALKGGGEVRVGDDVGGVGEVGAAGVQIVAVAAEEVDPSPGQTVQGEVPAAAVQEEGGVRLDEHPAAPDPVKEGRVAEEAHVPVNMGEDGDAAEVPAAELHLVQHAVRPGQHGRLHQEKGRPLQAEIPDFVRDADAREVENLGPEEDFGEIFLSLHGPP